MLPFRKNQRRRRAPTLRFRSSTELADGAVLLLPVMFLLSTAFGWGSLGSKVELLHILLEIPIRLLAAGSAIALAARAVWIWRAAYLPTASPESSSPRSTPVA